MMFDPKCIELLYLSKGICNSQPFLFFTPSIFFEKIIPTLPSTLGSSHSPNTSLPYPHCVNRTSSSSNIFALLIFSVSLSQTFFLLVFYCLLRLSFARSFLFLWFCFVLYVFFACNQIVRN